MKQDAYTLHKPTRCHFKRNRVIVDGIDQHWQMDLADMQSTQKFNDGYRYLLVCINVFSKYAWVAPLKNKTGPLLVEAFKIILGSGRKPEKIITDQGTKFFNKHFKALLKDEDIELYNTYNETIVYCRGTLDTYAENKNVAILYSKEHHAIHRHV